MIKLAASVGIGCLLVAASARAQTPALDFSQGCTASACHGGLAKGRSVHDPVSQGACDTCHEPDDEEKHTFTLSEEGAELCEQCHDAYDSKNIHDPVKNGSCTICHNPHASDAAHLLVAETMLETCLECHDELLEDLRFQHGPVAAGACTVCHDAHASDHTKLLTAEGAGLCTSCHEPMAQRLARAGSVHAPVKEDCVSCHNAHGSNDRFYLTGTMPDLCTDCHDSIAELIAEAPVGHDAVSKDRACANCHDAHASTTESLLINEPMVVCMSCHDRSVESDGTALVAMGKLLAENSNHHGPIRDKDCGACHTAHGGEHARLLTEAYPEKFYASFDDDAYALCFDCHDAELASEAATEDATNFRNGDQNLHYIHVNRQVKGRTCRACHNVHASDNPKHITGTVRFGTWDLPINFTASETGGTCQPGCHKRYGYDREKAAFNVQPEPEPDPAPTRDD